tara:strand:+ start:1495 stop:2070 length:576 start_codon:yes stop_codon:yes gene_type:complete
MKIILIISIIFSIAVCYTFLNRNSDLKTDQFSTSIYDYSIKTIEGNDINMMQFKGKKIMIVNVASKCGYTPQYNELQKIHEDYGDKIEIIGFPSNDFLWQEPGKNSDIKKFCTTKYGISFNLAEKSIVKKKKHQNSIYTWLSNKALNGWNDKAPSWNFCKYLIDEKGNLIYFYPSSIKPLSKEILDFINNE